MSKAEQVEALVEKHYKEIYYFCLKKLNYDASAASDCTQEVFLLLVKKQNVLNLDAHPRAWLYEVAGRLVRKYLREKQTDATWTVPLDDVDLLEDEVPPDSILDSLQSILTEDEFALLLAYYDADFGTKKDVALKYGLSMQQLYKNVYRIICKLRETMEECVQ